MKKILILSASPRRNGNSNLLCQEFAKGAQKSGHQVKHLFLRDYKIGYCTACRYCKEHEGTCALGDDMAQINQEIVEADVLVLATPIYYCTVNAQMKTLIDRTFSRLADMKNKELYYLMTSTDSEEEVTETALATFRWFAHFLPGSVEKGVVYGRGFRDAGEILGSRAMEEAYEMGRGV